VASQVDGDAAVRTWKAGRFWSPRIVTRQGECLSFPKPRFGAQRRRAHRPPAGRTRSTTRSRWRTDRGTAGPSPPARRNNTDHPFRIDFLRPARHAGIGKRTAPATWTDPRLVRGLRITANLVELLVLLLMSWALNARMPATERTAVRMIWFRARGADDGRAFVSLFALRSGAESTGAIMRPAGRAVTAARHGRGPRRTSDGKTTARIRAPACAPVSIRKNDWRYGDHRANGVSCPPAVGSPALRHRFPRSRPDAEGFRNHAGAGRRVDIAAAGRFLHGTANDRAERRVLAGAGCRSVSASASRTTGQPALAPQQELLVLPRDFVVRPSGPSRVVLAYFAGKRSVRRPNAFDRFRASPGGAGDAGMANQGCL